MAHSALEKFRANLLAYRDELTAAHRQISDDLDRLTLERQDMEITLAGIDQMLGGAPTASVKVKRSDDPKAPAMNVKELLRSMIIEQLRLVHPEGLTSEQLLGRIKPAWQHGDISGQRIGMNSRQITEVIGNGTHWYYVPPEGEAGPDATRQSEVM